MTESHTDLDRSLTFAESLDVGELRSLIGDLNKLRAREGVSTTSFALLQASQLVMNRHLYPWAFIPGGKGKP